jgi:oxygen-independent coproporphyrinogen-3 oxidase
VPGVYVHLPFCPYLCPYCDFAKWPMRTSSAQRYLRALHAEIEREEPIAAQTLYLGGGTPNAYDAGEIAALVEGLAQRYGLEQERTIEVNPELVRDGDTNAYRRCGIDRLSIGVQSFDARELQTLGRKHTPQQVRDVVTAARRAGITSISLDLMFAIPGQTPESWARSLDSAIALDVDHVSAYGLTIEEATPFSAWQAREPEAFFDDASEAELYAIAIDRLAAAGYAQYEVSNFAREGRACAHNLNYWANGEYLGFGVGAASYRGGVRWVHTRDFYEYVAAVEAAAAIPMEAERLEGGRRVGEAVMLALRTVQGVRLAEFKERYGIDVIEAYDSVVSEFARDGLVERTADSMRLTRRGRFLANDVCGAFVTFE